MKREEAVLKSGPTPQTGAVKLPSPPFPRKGGLPPWKGALFRGVPSRTVPLHGRALLIKGVPSHKGLSDGEVALLWRAPSHLGFPRSGGALSGGFGYGKGRERGE